MKRPLAILAFMAVMFAAKTGFAAPKTVTLAVENMTCASCPYIVKRTLATVPGVTQVDVSFRNKTARVTFDDAQADIAALTGATRQAGYPATLAR